MSTFKAKFQVLMELLELSERAFLFKLKQRKPGLTEAETQAELKDWYQTRPGAELGDGVGVPGNPRRFD